MAISTKQIMESTQLSDDTSSDAFNTEKFDLATITARITGSGTGSIKLQKNIEPNSLTPNWIDLENSEVEDSNNSQGFSSAGTISWRLKDICFSELRASISITLGSPTIEIRIYTKNQR